jgi:hypothetical protein
MTTDFMQVNKHGTVAVTKKKKVHFRILFPEKISSKHNDKLKTFSNKQKLNNFHYQTYML